MKSSEFSYGFSPDLPLESDLITRLRMPATASMEKAGERRIVYSDIDYNQHMNNTNYPDMLLNFLPDIKDKKVYSFAIHFMNEARLGTDFKVYLANEPEKTYFKTVLPDGKVGVEAIFMIEDR